MLRSRTTCIPAFTFVVKIYREAIDGYLADPHGYSVEPYWKTELDKVGNRGYGTGFYLGDADNTRPNYAGNRTGEDANDQQSPVLAGQFVITGIIHLCVL